MQIYIDAKGLPCPQPVLLAKRQIDGGESSFCIQVDNCTAVENLTRLAENCGYTVSISENSALFEVSFQKSQSGPESAVQAAAVPTPAMDTADQAKPGKWAVFVPRDCLGDGDPELGKALIRMYFYTISQAQDLPSAILFMNAGVKLPALDEQIMEHLAALQDRGVEILVCGTCLNFYHLTDPLKIGVVSNMYDITERMRSAFKVITL